MPAIRDLAPLLDQLPVGVSIVDAATGALVHANRRARELLGAAGVDLGDPERYVHTEGYRPDVTRFGVDEWPIRQALRGQVVANEIVRFRAPDGGFVRFETNASPIYDDASGHLVAAVVTFQDISERERRDEAARDFVANAAHELRTPVTAIAASIEVLQRGAKEDPAQRDRFLDHIERECDRLGRLARSLATLARAQSGMEPPPAEVVALAPLLETLAGRATTAASVDIRVDCAPELAALANRDLAEQALSSVVANAARYTAHGRIGVRAAARGDRVVVEVSDTGPGIECDERDRVFERFYRGRGREGGGFGLGLPIARDAVAAAGGTVEIESDPATGTTARMTFRAARPAAP